MEFRVTQDLFNQFNNYIYICIFIYMYMIIYIYNLKDLFPKL